MSICNEVGTAGGRRMYGVTVAVGVGVTVDVAVTVAVGVGVGVSVTVGVTVDVAVTVAVGVGVVVVAMVGATVAVDVITDVPGDESGLGLIETGILLSRTTKLMINITRMAMMAIPANRLLTRGHRLADACLVTLCVTDLRLSWR